jgi:hypothetical protein
LPASGRAGVRALGARQALGRGVRAFVVGDHPGGACFSGKNGGGDQVWKPEIQEWSR